MKKSLLIIAALLLPVPALAQETEEEHEHDPEHHAQMHGDMCCVFEGGWHARVDRDGMLEEDAFRQENGTFHVQLGPAAVFYHPEQTAEGEYGLGGTFHQPERLDHNEAYGLVFGGTNLENENQDYMYFLVRQTGEYLIKHRADDETTHTIIDWTEHDAVQPVGEDGGTNRLDVEVRADEVDFLVNDVVVQTLPKPPVNADGIYGFRVNHRLGLEISDFGRTDELEPEAGYQLNVHP